MPFQRARTSDTLAYALLALSAACWAGNHIVGRWVAVAHPPVPPGGLTFWRWLLAFAVILPFSWRHLKADWPLIVEHRWTIIGLGLWGGTGFSVVQYYALYYTTAVNVGVMNSVGPACIILAGMLIFRDRVRPVQLGGIAVSLLGVLVVITHGELRRLSQLSFNLGDLLAFGNMAIFAVYSSCLRLNPKIAVLSFVTLLCILASLGAVPVMIVETALGHPPRATWPTFVAVVYTGLFTSVAAYFSWSAGIGALGSQRASAFLHLTPLFGAVFAVLLLGEQPRLFHAVGLTLIVAGVTVAARRPAET